MSQKALDVLNQVDTVVGYTIYIDLIRPLVEGKAIVSTPMKKETIRVGAAIDAALEGRSVAIVSSGDPGIYAMAGLAFEMCRQKKISLCRVAETDTVKSEPVPLKIEVIPGIPALGAGASLLGAPLTHDFAAISLSDLLTPWETIEKRLKAAADADFVIVLYNPKSKKRHWQLKKACDIIGIYRPADTPVGVVSRAMREGQNVQIVSLEDLPNAPVDMQTTVFVGNRSTFEYCGFMVTPRGYGEKYELK